MFRILVCLTGLVLASSAGAATTSAPKELKDLHFGEALYHAWQGEWFEAIGRLDTELGQFYTLDEPELDTLYPHFDHAEFAVGDFELAYRMHHRAGRAITRVIEGRVDELVRNDAIYRLARLHFQKNQPENGLQAVERIRGSVPPAIWDDVAFLRAQLLLANGRAAEAAVILKELQSAKGLEGFSTYNHGIALLRNGNEQEGRRSLDRTGQLASSNEATLAIKDKANLVLGYKLLEEQNHEAAGLVLDRVRLSGPFSNRALLGSGWASASQGQYDRALVPWTILAGRQVTDPAVQEAMLALPYAYSKLNVPGRAALLYGSALEAFGGEIDKLDASLASIREGKFLKALVREELKQDANWVVKLRSLPETPETYYLLDLMASHDFQESLKNFIDLEQLRKKLATWEGDLDAFEEIIGQRRGYYEPLLPAIDREFRQLDSRMRLRLEQRERIEQRLHAMLSAPRPDYLATAAERISREQLDRLEAGLAAGAAPLPPETVTDHGDAQEVKPTNAGFVSGYRVPQISESGLSAIPAELDKSLQSQRQGGSKHQVCGQAADKGEVAPCDRLPATEARINRLRGVLVWHIHTEYDQRLTDAYRHLRELNQHIEQLRRQYTAFVRTRQAATQSYEGYDEGIRRQRLRIATAREQIKELMARQGHLLEAMAIAELTRRSERLEEMQVKARFALADSYDRATRTQVEKGVGQ